MVKLANVYGSTLTIWFGNHPIIILTDLEEANILLNDKNLSGRPYSIMSKYLSVYQKAFPKNNTGFKSGAKGERIPETPLESKILENPYS